MSKFGIQQWNEFLSGSVLSFKVQFGSFFFIANRSLVCSTHFFINLFIHQFDIIFLVNLPTVNENKYFELNHASLFQRLLYDEHALINIAKKNLSYPFKDAVAC